LSFSLCPINNSISGIAPTINSIWSDTDTFATTDLGLFTSRTLVAFFDLRQRESFVQVTNIDNENANMHIQIFNVSQDCNENDFFDLYTPNDTHVYNMRDILTNNGNVSGAVLPENAYGFVAISVLGETGGNIFGNFRIIDETGYEYRTDMQFFSARRTNPDPDDGNYHFNFNQSTGIVLSDIVGITYNLVKGEAEVLASNPTDAHLLLDIDIVNNNEDIFSCRNVIFSCIDENSTRAEGLLEFVANISEGSANVASFEYGINEAVPHSRGGEPLCPGNNVTEGTVNLNQVPSSDSFETIFHAYVGLNNGNGRGSMDSITTENVCIAFPIFCGIT